MMTRSRSKAKASTGEEFLIPPPPPPRRHAPRRTSASPQPYPGDVVHRLSSATRRGRPRQTHVNANSDVSSPKKARLSSQLDLPSPGPLAPRQDIPIVSTSASTAPATPELRQNEPLLVRGSLTFPGDLAMVDFNHVVTQYEQRPYISSATAVFDSLVPIYAPGSLNFVPQPPPLRSFDEDAAQILLPRGYPRGLRPIRFAILNPQPVAGPSSAPERNLVTSLSVAYPFPCSHSGCRWAFKSSDPLVSHWIKAHLLDEEESGEDGIQMPIGSGAHYTRNDLEAELDVIQAILEEDGRILPFP